MILGVKICFCLCWMDVFCFLVSVALCGPQERMLPGSTERWLGEKDSDWQREKTTKCFGQKTRWIQLASGDGVHGKWKLWQEERILQGGCSTAEHSLEGHQPKGFGDGFGLKQELEFPVHLFTGGGLP